MPRQNGQKAKIIALLRILQEQTDDDHRLSVPELLDELERCGVAAERKSIYTDIETLQEMGYDIQNSRGRGGGYYMASRDFQLAELKLLVDAVQASRFITTKKSNELIDKLKKLASKYQANELQHQVYVTDRVKNRNESIYLSIDQLHRAIAENRQVSFAYYQWSVDKTMHQKRGKSYRVSPIALCYNDGNYYLVAYQSYDPASPIRNYRVDRMKSLEICDQPREGAEERAAFDIVQYTGRIFGMFGGEPVTATLRCKKSLANVVIDRFGTTPTLINEDDDYFHFQAEVTDSAQFYGWVLGFGGDIEVIAPQQLRQKLADYTCRLAQQYAPAPQEP